MLKLINVEVRYEWYLIQGILWKVIKKSLTWRNLRKWSYFYNFINGKKRKNSFKWINHITNWGNKQIKVRNLVFKKAFEN